MPRGPTKKKTEDTTSQSLESKLWATADKLRGHLDAADYKHVVLGLIFLKYISDRFAQRHEEIIREEAGTYAAEDRDEYTAEGVFWVPASSRWAVVQTAAKQPDIGKRIDGAMTDIERENPHLKNILPKGYARPTLDQRRLGELVDLIGTIGLGTAEHQARDTLGRVYEYFLGRFASAEGKRGGEFYTPASVVRTLVTMLAPYKGRIYDPCCGSGGMFVQSEKFIEAHGGKVGDISVYGEESNPNTWKLALMNLAIRGIEADLGLDELFRLNEHAAGPATGVIDATFIRGQHGDQHAHYGSRGVELTAALTFRAGEHAQKVFIDAAQGISGLMFGGAKSDGADEVHQFAQTALVEGRAGIAFGQDVFQMRVFPLNIGHGLVNALADVRLFGGSLHHMPAGGCGHPEHAFRRVLVAVFGVGTVHLSRNLGMALRKAVRDVLQEDEAQHDMLVVGGVQMATQLVGGGPELGFEALMAGVFGLLLGWSARHGVPF